MSDETAVGRNPLRAVRYMRRILAAVEGSLLIYDIDTLKPRGLDASRPDWAIADAAVETALKVGAKAIVTITGSGRTARLISAGRPSVPLFSFSPDPSVRRRTALMWGVVADAVKPIRDAETIIRDILEHLRDRRAVKRRDRVVVVFGSPLWEEGTKTNCVLVVEA